MGYNVIFAPQALEQLEQIVDFIAQNDPAAAARFGNNWSIARCLGTRVTVNFCQAGAEIYSEV